jgi:AcrR family transcriptional regulator
MIESMSESSAYHHGSLQEAVLSLAVTMLRNGSTSLPPLRELASQLGVTHGALYRHFSDKEALEAAVIAAGFDFLADAMANSGEAGSPTSPSVMRAYVNFALNEQSLYRLMFARRAGPLLQEPIPGKAVRRVIGIATQAFHNEQADPAKIRDQVVSAWGMAHGLCEFWSVGLLRAKSQERAEAFIMERLKSGLLV